MTCTNPDKSNNLYNPGEYMMRLCGYDNWEYCDGLCEKCYKHKANQRTFASNHTIPNMDMPYSTSTKSVQGFPQYLFRRDDNDI